MDRTAMISDDGLYRYRLGRSWDWEKGMVYFVMLNPSVADSERDDATIRRCIGFAKSWGFGRLVVGNLFAWRGTNPKALLSAKDPVGEENDRHLLSDAVLADRVVCAWGAHPAARMRAERVLELLLSSCKHVGHLGFTVEGQPKHPLRLAKSTPWVSYAGGSVVSGQAFL